MLEPSYREAGSGPGVLCLHANASSSGQWRGLMDLLAPKFRVLAPDLYDVGSSPRWPSDRVIQLQDEVELVEPVLERAGARLALIGVGAGVVLGLGLMRLASSLLYGVTASDPVIYTLAALVLSGVALLACYVPARRAMNVDPSTALRYE